MSERDWQPIETAPHGNDVFSPYVLVINRQGVMAVACWVDDGDWYLPGGGHWKNSNLTHWMPLPNPPAHTPSIEHASS
jgi:hypothetical protein